MPNKVFVLFWFGKSGFFLVGTAHPTRESAMHFAEAKRNMNDCDEPIHNLNDYHIIECLVLD